MSLSLLTIISIAIAMVTAPAFLVLEPTAVSYHGQTFMNVAAGEGRTPLG